MNIPCLKYTKSARKMVKRAWEDSWARRLEVLKEIKASPRFIECERAEYARIIKSFG
jgi:hypothetical protein